VTFRTAIIVFALLEAIALACFVAYVLLRH
jgi:hypothetical protein